MATFQQGQRVWHQRRRRWATYVGPASNMGLGVDEVIVLFDGTHTESRVDVNNLLPEGHADIPDQTTTVRSQ